MTKFTMYGTFEQPSEIFSTRYAVFSHEQNEACAGLDNLRLCTDSDTAADYLKRSSDVCYVVDLRSLVTQYYVQGERMESRAVGDTACGREDGSLVSFDLSRPLWLFSSHRYEDVDGLCDLYGTYDSIQDAELALAAMGGAAEQIRLYDLRDGLIYSA